MAKESAAIKVFELLLARVKEITSRFQRNDVKIRGIHDFHAVAKLHLDAITIELDKSYLSQNKDLIPPIEVNCFEFSLRVHTNYQFQDKSGRQIQSNNTPKNLFMLESIHSLLSIQHVLDDDGNFLIHKIDNLEPGLVFTDSDTLGGGMKIFVQQHVDAIDYQSKLHTDTVSAWGRIFTHSDDYRYCELTLENGIVHKLAFTSMQADSVRFLHLSNKGELPELPQSKILEEIGSKSNRLSEVFKSCKDEWRVLIVKGKKRDSYRLNI